VVSLPNVLPQNAILICHAAVLIFETEMLVFDVAGEFIIVGNLYGHVLDLLRVFIQSGLPPATKYIFLGDYVDHGGRQST
jgi:hypothetical protein